VIPRVSILPAGPARGNGAVITVPHESKGRSDAAPGGSEGRCDRTRDLLSDAFAIARETSMRRTGLRTRAQGPGKNPTTLARSASEGSRNGAIFPSGRRETEFRDGAFPNRVWERGGASASRRCRRFSFSAMVSRSAARGGRGRRPAPGSASVRAARETTLSQAREPSWLRSRSRRRRRFLA
jgi:hypothetical protein